MQDERHGRCLGMPATDMARAVEHYQRLGFTFTALGEATMTGATFANRAA
jgi:hypothetical protein